MCAVSRVWRARRERPGRVGLSGFTSSPARVWTSTKRRLPLRFRSETWRACRFAPLLHGAQRAQRQPRAWERRIATIAQTIDEHIQMAVRDARFEAWVESVPDRAGKPCQCQADVSEVDTGSKRTLLLGRGDQFALRGGGRVQQRFHLGRASYLVIEQRHDGRGTDIQRTMHVSAKRGERVSLLSGRGCGLRVRACHHIDSDCRHERSAPRKVAIQSRDAHAGATSDGLERYLRTDFDEQRTGGVQETAATPLRIRSHARTLRSGNEHRDLPRSVSLQSLGSARKW